MSSTSNRNIGTSRIEMKRLDVVVITVAVDGWATIGGMATLARWFLISWNIHTSVTAVQFCNEQHFKDFLDFISEIST